MGDRSSANQARVKLLLDIPTSEWKKNDWIAAAKILAMGPDLEGGMIASAQRSWSERIAWVSLAERVREYGKPKKPGRPTRFTPDNVQLLWTLVELTRGRLAEELGVSTSAISDKEVATRIAELHMLNDQSRGHIKRRRETIKSIQGDIKYLKRKRKSG